MDVNNRAIQGVLSLAQTRAYADASGVNEAHLVIFDRTPGKPWSEKIWQRQEQCRGGIGSALWEGASIEVRKFGSDRSSVEGWRSQCGGVSAA